LATYGTDLSTYRGTTPDLSFTRISGRRAVAEAVARRWSMRRGTLVTDEDAGLDLRDWLNAALSQADLYALASALKTEGERDERVAEVDVTVRLDPSTSVLTVIGAITPIDSDAFRLVLNVSAVTVEILEPV
jgi:hypothetical protein